MKTIALLSALAVLGVAKTSSAQTQVFTCEPIEVAPGLKVTIPCMADLPELPVDAPDAAIPLPGFVPAAIDLRAENLVGPVKDQAQVGVCWSFAVSTLMDNSLRRQGRSDVISPLHVIAADSWKKIWKNGTEPLASETAWPYVPKEACELTDASDRCGSRYGVRAGSWKSDPVLLGELSRARTMGVARAGKAKALKGDRIGQIVAALASGRAVYANLAINGRAWGYRAVRAGVLAPYSTRSRGGHAVVLVGYRTLLTGRQFLIQNSWGKGWGKGGYVWITEAELRRHMHDAFVLDAILPGGVVSNLLPRQLLIALPPIQICPSGLPAVMGQCWLG